MKQIENGHVVFNQFCIQQRINTIYVNGILEDLKRYSELSPATEEIEAVN